MPANQKRTGLILAGALGFLTLLTCAVCAALFLYVGWSLPAPAAQPLIPQPTTAISVGNMEQVQLLATFSQLSQVRSLTWSSDSRLLAAGGTTGENKDADRHAVPVKLWDVITGSAARLLEQGDPAEQFQQVDTVNDVSFSPDNRWLAATFDYGITVWNVPDGKKLRTINQWHDTLSDLAFSPDGGTVFAVVHGYSNGTIPGECRGIQSWDIVSARPLRCFDEYSGLLATPGGKLIARKGVPEGNHYRTALLELDTGRMLATVDQNPRAMSHDSRVLAQDSGPIVAESTQSTLTLTDVTNGKVLGKWAKFVYGAPVAFSPDDTLIAAERERDGFLIFSLSDFFIALWDPQSGKTSELDIGSTAPRSIAFSPDSRFLAIGKADGAVQLWGIKP